MMFWVTYIWWLKNKNNLVFNDIQPLQSKYDNTAKYAKKTVFERWKVMW